jgi:hypothetical protein
VCKTVFFVNSVKSDYVLAVFVVRLVEDYLTEYGAWPHSWHDLESVKRPESSEWPAISRRVQERVIVDFSVNVDDLATQSAAQFHAIRTIETNELFEDAYLGRIHVENLLKRIRKVSRSRVNKVTM